MKPTVDPLLSLEMVTDLATSLNARLAITVLIVAFLVFVLLKSQSLQRWLNCRMRPLYADVIVTCVLISTCLFAVSVTVTIWGLTGELVDLWREYELSGDVVARASISFLLLLTAYLVARFVKRVVQNLMNPAAAITDHQQEVTHRVTQVLVWAFAIFFVAGIWVDDLGGLLIGAGFLGIVLGMAANQTLSSMLAGFVLMFSRPFEIGDWIVVEESEGIVTDISIINTRIQSPDGEYMIIPNDLVNSNPVTNRSRRGRLRVEVEVGVDFDADVERASELAEEAVTDLDESMTTPAPGVITKSFTESSVMLGARFWIDQPTSRRFNKAKTAAIGAIKRRFEEEGIKIPYPQRELSGRPGEGGFGFADERIEFDENDDVPNPTSKSTDRAPSDTSARSAPEADGIQEPATEDD